jgi:hypothetical protein
MVMLVDVGIHDVTSYSNDQFYEECHWACLDINDTIPSPFHGTQNMFSWLPCGFIHIVYLLMNEVL